MKKLCLLLACLLTLTACEAAAPGAQEPTQPSQSNVAQTTAPNDAAPLKPDKTFNSLMDELLADTGSNACISPLSFKFALGIAYNGAKGSTAELLSALFGVPPDEMNAWALAYLEEAKKYDGSQRDAYSPPNPELRIANSYWLRKGLEGEIAKRFTNTLTRSFHAQSGKFDKKPDPVNDWVSDATNGKIEEILAEIDPNALSYLVNALYFNAHWINDFDENRTRQASFTNIDGSKVTTDMLHGGADSHINTAQFEGMAKHLYGGFTFTAVMPKTDAPVTMDSLAEAQKSADESYTSVILTIPKYEIDTRVDFIEGNHPEFDALFAHHGMDGALSADADTTDLLISQIIHKTTFSLAEAGIEASAATVVGLLAGGAAPSESKEVAVTFDQPFYFTLTDKHGEVLFVGKVMTLEA